MDQSRLIWPGLQYPRIDQFPLNSLPNELNSSILGCLGGRETLKLLKVNRGLRDHALYHGFSRKKIENLTFIVVGDDDISISRYEIGIQILGDDDEYVLFKPLPFLSKIKTSKSLILKFQYYQSGRSFGQPNIRPRQGNLRGNRRFSLPRPNNGQGNLDNIKPVATEGCLRRFFKDLIDLRDLEIDIQNHWLLTRMHTDFHAKIENCLVRMESGGLIMHDLQVASGFFRDSRRIEVITEQNIGKTWPFPGNRCRYLILVNLSGSFGWAYRYGDHSEIVKGLLEFGVPSSEPGAVLLLDTGTLANGYAEFCRLCSGYQGTLIETEIGLIRPLLEGLGKELGKDLTSMESTMFRRRLSEDEEVLLIVSKKNSFVLAKNVEIAGRAAARGLATSDLWSVN